jgi:hypothetical protein
MLLKLNFQYFPVKGIKCLQFRYKKLTNCSLHIRAQIYHLSNLLTLFSSLEFEFGVSVKIPEPNLVTGFELAILVISSTLFLC